MNASHRGEPRTTRTIEVLALSDHEWRVRYADADEHDGTSLLGFVERMERGYEVICIGRPGERARFPTLEDSTAYLEGAHDRRP